MKKLCTLLFAAGLFAMASCNSNNNQKDQAAINAQIDSLANVKAQAQEALDNARRDSIINAQAQQKAAMEMRAGHRDREERASRNTDNNQAATPVQQQPATIGNGKPSMTPNNNNNSNNNGNSGTIGNGKPRM